MTGEPRTMCYADLVRATAFSGALRMFGLLGYYSKMDTSNDDEVGVCR